MKKFFPFSKVLFGFAAVAILLFITKCGSNSSTPASGTFSSVYQIFQTTNCVQCHSGPSGTAASESVTFDVSTQSAAYTAMTTGKVTSGATPGCAGQPYVTPSQISASYLVAVLITNSGYVAPSGCTPTVTHNSGSTSVVNLTSAQQTSITQWITNGALNN